MMKHPMFSPDVNSRRHSGFGAMYSYILVSESPEGVRVWRHLRMHTSDLLGHTPMQAHTQQRTKRTKRTDVNKEW